MRDAATHKPKFTKLAKVADSQSPIVYGIVQPGPDIPDGVIFVQSRDVGGKIPLGALNRTSPEIAKQYRRSRIYPGDILFSLRGNIGQSSLAPPELEGANIARGVARIRVAKENDPEYIRYVLQGSALQKLIARNANGSTFREISIDELRKLPIPDVPLPEQRKISEILRTWDEALEKLTALRAANLKRRVWFRTHLFTGKVRLPGHTGEWRSVPLSEVLTEHGLKGTGAEEVFSVSVHKGLINQIEHLGRSFAAAKTDHYNRVLPGDIVYTKSPTGDFPLGIIKQSKIEQEVIVSPLYGVFSPTTYALGVILDALFESSLAARNYLHPLVQKGAKNTIAVTNRQFLEGKLRLPMDPAEQAAIADVVNTSHAELAGIDAEIEALTRQKRGLMQKLLTGEWRVEVGTSEYSNTNQETTDAK